MGMIACTCGKRSAESSSHQRARIWTVVSERCPFPITTIRLWFADRSVAWPSARNDADVAR
jgi:hypothetical protein